MEPRFKQGDVVQLKSGGPSMTVFGFDRYRDYSDENEYRCVWFDGPNRKERVVSRLRFGGSDSVV